MTYHFRNHLKTFLPLIAIVFGIANFSNAQTQAYFVDGYHGGVYGHFPRWQTNFMVDQLEANPAWKIALEIEPETWDSVKVYDPAAYKRFGAALADPGIAQRVEVVNPSYGQSYLYTISGESVIRQFGLGIAKLKSHFPSLTFLTYTSEEPCFTSALPQILTSFGFKYAVLKNPNTCWGGYMRAYGKEKVSWIGPDGTTIPTVTRYASEGFEKNSTWQTTAWSNSRSYIDAALAIGIKHPVGMCLQDAGWKYGPWLKTIPDLYEPSEYVLWRDYFEKISTAPATDSWRVSQDDVMSGLVWGAQVLQKISLEVRKAENRVVVAEKIATLNSIRQHTLYPIKTFDNAWQTLLLGQHHDCWIVPYNGKPGHTWADKTTAWTNNTISKSDSIIMISLPSSAKAGNSFINVYNTTAAERLQVVVVPVVESAEPQMIIDAAGKAVASQSIKDNGRVMRAFVASVPSVGKATYQFVKSTINPTPPRSTVSLGKDSVYVVKTDMYELSIDAKHGGTIKSIKAKFLDNKEFVDGNSANGFNELRGFFYDENKFLSSRTQSAKVTVLEDGPVRTKVSLSGTVAGHPFTQTITLNSKDPKIDVSLKIDWKGNPGIGKYSQAKNFDAKNPEKAFYNNRYKLLALFPAKLSSPRIFKDAPFDVTESHEENSFFNRWDSIKNNVALSWVDLVASSNDYGMALLMDHTNSYAFGKDHPLGMVVQYSGVGLWGRNYKITQPTILHYALLPHKGKWDSGDVSQQSTFFKEPIITQLSNNSNEEWISWWLKVPKGWELSSLQKDGDDVLVRVYNAAGSDGVGEIAVNSNVTAAEVIALNGASKESLAITADKMSVSSIKLAIPRFGIRTIRLKTK